METGAIWYDITNVPHVHFLKPIINHLTERGFPSVFSVRDFLETEQLFRAEIDKPYMLIGSHAGKGLLRKLGGMISRMYFLNRKIPSYSVKISIGGDASEYLSLFRNRPSITFDDNELAPNWMYGRLVRFAFWTDAVPLDVLIKQGFNPRKLFRYHGYKEDIYIADFKPDPTFPNLLPFSDYVLIRSENIRANYVRGKNEYLFPHIIRSLADKGINVVVLPRNPIDRVIAAQYKNVFIPSKVVNGLDACYYANAVITGAGTLAREAACMGVPAISFFTGNKLMSVDKSLINEGLLLHSRNVSEISEKVMKSNRKTTDFRRSKSVQEEVFSVLDNVLDSINRN